MNEYYDVKIKEWRLKEIEKKQKKFFVIMEIYLKVLFRKKL